MPRNNYNHHPVKEALVKTSVFAALAISGVFGGHKLREGFDSPPPASIYTQIGHNNQALAQASHDIVRSSSDAFWDFCMATGGIGLTALLGFGYGAYISSLNEEWEVADPTLPAALSAPAAPTEVEVYLQPGIPHFAANGNAPTEHTWAPRPVFTA